MKLKFPNFLKIASKKINNKYEIFKTVSADGSINYIAEGKFINLLSDALGFKYKIEILMDGSANRHAGGGNWTGEIGMVQRGEADMAINRLFISEDRTEVIDFSYPYYLTEVTFITNQPQPLPKTLGIIYPFSLAVWLFLGLCLFVVSSLFYFLNRKQSFIRIFLSMFGNLLDQSFRMNPSAARDKFLVLAWVLGAMFLSNSYKGTLLAYLSFPTMTGVRDVEELAKAVLAGSHRCFTRKGSALNDMFLQMNIDKMRVIGKSLSENSVLKDMDEFMMDFPPNSAFITIRPYMVPYEEALYLSRDTFYTLLLGIVVRQGFCCMPALDRAINRIVESGLYDKFMRESNDLTSTNPVYVSTENTNSLTLEDTAGAFFILIIGHAVAIVAFLVEKILGRNKLGKAKSSSRKSKNKKFVINDGKINNNC